MPENESNQPRWTQSDFQRSIDAAVAALGGKPEVLCEDQKKLDEIIANIKKDGGGYLHLYTDGVYRSIGDDRATVIDAVPLTSGLVKAMLDRMPYDKEMEDRFRGVDGTKTAEEEWYKLPKILEISDEQRKEDIRKGKEQLEELKKRKERGEFKPCKKSGVKKISDYNLEP